MMDHRFDPYDLLITIKDRLTRLEHAHNKMAQAYQQSEGELTIALHSLNQLQQKHLALSQKFNKIQIDNQLK